MVVVALGDPGTPLVWISVVAAGSDAGAASSALASSLAEGSGVDADVEAGLELVLASLPDFAICDEHAMMLPIANRARQAATVVFSFNIRSSWG